MRLSAPVCSLLLCLLLGCGLVRHASAAACYASFSQADFPNCEKLSDTYALHWKVKDGNVTFAIDVDEASRGWAGLGVSQAGGMHGADIWIVHRTEAGEGWAAWDMHSEDTVTPSMDASQDVTLVGTPMTTSHSIKAVITRKLKACDAGDLSIYSNRTMAFIWAHHNEDGYHGPVSRGTWMLQLEPTATTSPAAVDAMTKSLTMAMPNITVPENATSYVCVNFKTPADVKRHITEISFDIDTTDLVHHVVLHHCTKAPSVGLGKLYPCFDSMMLPECEGFTAVWLPGSKTYKSPAEAAFPLMGYYALQVHYNNPKNLPNMVDSTAVTLKYTTQLRKHDLAVLAVTQFDIKIPAGQPRVIPPAAVCPSECTAKFTEPITVVAHMQHMHTLGSTIATQRVRDGQELMPLGVRNRWDFNWQVIEDPNVGSEVIQPGDAIITTCQYNSTKKSTLTKFGFGTDEEMCVDFLTYYPAQNLDTCAPMAPGFASCGVPGRFSSWLGEAMANATHGAPSNITAAPARPQINPTNQPAPAAGAGAAARPVPEGNAFMGNADPAVLAALFAKAAEQGLLEKYNASMYEPGVYARYVAEDGCPAFLSQATAAEGPASPATAAPAADATKSTSAAGEGAGRMVMLKGLLLASVVLVLLQVW